MRELTQKEYEAMMGLIWWRQLINKFGCRLVTGKVIKPKNEHSKV